MTLGELPSAGIYIDFALGVIVLLILFYEIAVQQRNRKKISELEKKIIAIQQAQAEVFASLEHKANAIKEVLFERTNPLTNKFNELSKKANALYERNEALRQELEQKVGPLQASVDDTAAKFSSSHDALMKVVQEGKNEIERVAKEVEGFAEEIEKMKDFIRDGTIDLEL